MTQQLTARINDCAAVLEDVIRGAAGGGTGLLARARAKESPDSAIATMRAALNDLDRAAAASFATIEAESAQARKTLEEREAELSALLQAIGRTSTTIRTGSEEIAHAAEDLAKRTETNAANLEQTNAAVNQMNLRLRNIAQAATQTVERADGALTTVTSGRNLADEAVAAMTRVSESAKGIDDVIEGLDKIAFQTRVLAMNAAVEAGRAGDAGRGFAVVADLVSALAMRAEEEAKRAREQLSVTQSDIGTARDAVENVDGALVDISSGVGELHDLLTGIAADNQVQANAVGEIAAAIGSMEESTQRNAAMVEETSAAARNLVAEIANLAQQANHASGGKIAAVASPVTHAAKPRPAASMMPSPLATSQGAVQALAPDDWSSF